MRGVLSFFRILVGLGEFYFIKYVSEVVFRVYLGGYSVVEENKVLK